MCPSSLVPALLLLAWMALSATQQASEVQTSNSAEPEAEARSEYGCLEVPESVAGSYNDLQVLCSVDRLEKSVQTDREAQKTFNRIKTKLQNILKQLIKSYEKRLKEKKAQIAKKNKIIKGLKVDIKDLKQKLALSTSKAKAIGQ